MGLAMWLIDISKLQTIVTNFVIQYVVEEVIKKKMGLFRAVEGFKVVQEMIKMLIFVHRSLCLKDRYAISLQKCIYYK